MHVMKRSSKIMLFALTALPVAGIATVGVLRAQQLAPVQVDVAGRAVPAPPAAGLPPAAEGGTATVFVQTDSGVAARVVRQNPFAQLWSLPEPDDAEMSKLKQADGAMGRQEEQLVERYASTEDAEQRSAIKAELAEHLTNHFSIQEQILDRELARVEARVKKLRELTQKRRDAQKTIIEQRLDQLLRDADGLGWTPPPSDRGAAVVPPGRQYGTRIGVPAPTSRPPEPSAAR
jgi:hypothetical protein